MSNRKKRIFIVDADDLNTYTCKGTIKNNDLIFILAAPEDFKVPDSLSQCHVRSNNDEYDTDKLIELIQTILKGNEDVYFIGETMKEYYDAIRDIVAKKCHGVAKHDSFAVQKKILYRAEEQTSMFDQDLIASMAGSVKQNIDGTRPDSECPPQNKVDNKIKVNESRKQSSKTQVNDIKKTIYQEVQDAKTDLMYALRNRLQDHISRQIKIELSVNDMFNLIKLILKANDLGDLIESWQTTGNPPLSAFNNDNEFFKIKGEATYYYNLCTMIYEKDVYDNDSDK